MQAQNRALFSCHKTRVEYEKSDCFSNLRTRGASRDYFIISAKYAHDTAGISVPTFTNQPFLQETQESVGESRLRFRVEGVTLIKRGR
jgi:hypothetical protein